MSENITILEGGKAENFGQIAKLKTSNGSGYDLWVPEKDVDAKSLSVKKNGLYHTREYIPTKEEYKDKNRHFYENIYGWDTVTVSVKSKVTGKKRKGGDDVDVSVEVDDDGNLIEKELPTYISIITPPRKTGYYDGDSIDIAGIVVKAYHADGTEYDYDPQHNNVISLDELSIDPTVADITKVKDEVYVDGDVRAMKLTTNAQKRPSDGLYWVFAGDKAIGHRKDGNIDSDFTLELMDNLNALNNPSAPQPTSVYLTRYNNQVYAYRITPNMRIWSWGSNYSENRICNVLNFPYNEQELGMITTTSRTYYNSWSAIWVVGEHGMDFANVPESEVEPTGAFNPTIESGGLEVDVSWDRGDGTLLHDSFNVSVSETPES